MLYAENFERTESLVVPMIARPVPVEISETATIGVAAVDPVGVVLEICLSPSISSRIEYSLPCSRNTPAFFQAAAVAVRATTTSAPEISKQCSDNL